MYIANKMEEKSINASGVVRDYKKTITLSLIHILCPEDDGPEEGIVRAYYPLSFWLSLSVCFFRFFVLYIT